jgi:transcriptional regulator with XRE-family HTH domain
MSPTEFIAALRAQGLTQRALIAEIADLTGCTVSKSTLSRMATGESAVNPFLAAYLALRGRHGTPTDPEGKTDDQ